MLKRLNRSNCYLGCGLSGPDKPLLRGARIPSQVEGAVRGRPPVLQILSEFFDHLLSVDPSMLWHCWLGIRKSIRPVKIECWGVGMVICLERGADCLHMVQLMPLHPKIPIVFCLISIQTSLPFGLQCFDAFGWVAGKALACKKLEWWGAGMVICLEQGADLHMA